MPTKLRCALVAGSILVGVAFAARAQHDPHRHQAGEASARDARVIVTFPEQLRIHTLANMRDHLLALQEIQDALAIRKFDEAARIAEQRLGMSSLGLHGAHEVARYMPEGMRNLGTEMHRSASRFAVAASDASVTNDVLPALSMLARVTGRCVACHASYRLQ